MAEHNHLTRDIKPPGQCPGCDDHHAATPKKDVGLIYNPPAPHVCGLLASDGWRPKDLRPGAVEVCGECGRVWVYDPIPWERIYRPLLPWPFDRKQRAALRAVRVERGTDG